MKSINEFAGNRKGMEMTFGTIAAAIIMLILIVVLIAVFMGKISFTSQSLSSCESNGGKCLAVAEGDTCSDTDPNFGPLGAFECADDKVCCIESPLTKLT